MRIRKKRSNFLEDFSVGQLFRHKVGKTVTEGLFNAFTEFGMTTNPLSKNLRYAEQYGFRGLVAPPGLVMNIVFSQSVDDISENARANLEYRDLRFGAPVYIGDTLEVETTILLGHKFVQHDGEWDKTEIFYLERELAVKRRSHYT